MAGFESPIMVQDNTVVTTIELVEGGNIFKQGHHLTLGYIAYDEMGEVVDFTGKTLTVSIWGRKGIAFEADAVYKDGLLRFTLDQAIPSGDYQVEFTATLSTDEDYRKKYPTSTNSGRISVKQSADDLGAVGISIFTIDKFEKKQKELQDAYHLSVDSKVETLEADFEQAVGAITVDSEVVLARGEATTLRARLDAENATLTQELADTAVKVRNEAVVLSTSTREKSAIATFISDDGSIQDYNSFIPFMKNKGVTAGLAIVTDYVGKSSAYMDGKQLREVANDGFEIMFHTHLHRNSMNLTKEEFIADMETGLGLLAQNAHYPKSFVYPFNAYSYENIEVTSKYFKYGFSRTNGSQAVSGQNFPKIDNQKVARIGFGSYFDLPVPNHPQDTTSIAYYKSRVDEAIANKSLIAFVLHPWDEAHTATQYQHLGELIDYLRLKGVPIKNPTAAMDVAGNIAQIGYKDESKLFIDNEGLMDGTSLRVIFANENTHKPTTKPSEFPAGKRVITPISVGHALSTLFPEGKSGILTTTVISRFPNYTFQEYTITADGSFRTYKRKQETSGDWGTFELDTKVLMAGGNNFLIQTNSTTLTPKSFAATSNTIRDLTPSFDANGTMTLTTTAASGYLRPSNVPIVINDNYPSGEYILNGLYKTAGATLEVVAYRLESDGETRPYKTVSFPASANLSDFSIRFTMDRSYASYILSINVKGAIGTSVSLRDLGLRRGNVEVSYSPRLV